MRIDKTNHYLNIAETVLERSTCIRRVYGAVLVKNDRVIATGYNGSCEGEDNCCDTQICERERLHCKPGENYELCVSVHAEQNALLNVSRAEAIGSVMYLTGKDANTGEYVSTGPCKLCTRFIKNMGVKEVIIRDTKLDYHYGEITKFEEV